MKEKMCSFCKKKYKPKTTSKTMYCSRKCSGAARKKKSRVILICPHCKNEFEVRASRANEGRKHCSVSCANTSRRKNVKSRYNEGREKVFKIINDKNWKRKLKIMARNWEIKYGIDQDDLLHDYYLTTMEGTFISPYHSFCKTLKLLINKGMASKKKLGDIFEFCTVDDIAKELKAADHLQRVELFIDAKTILNEVELKATMLIAFGFMRSEIREILISEGSSLKQIENALRSIK